MSAANGGIEVRPLVPGDATAFQELRLRGLLESPSAFASSHEEECGTPIETVAERLAEREGKAIFGAFEHERLVGVVGLERQQMRKLAHKAGLWGMYVEPSARNRGVGRLRLERGFMLLDGELHDEVHMVCIL